MSDGLLIKYCLIFVVVFKRDLRYLFRLLEKRKIRPSIEQYIKVRDIHVIREYMRRNPGSGAVVCEPWRQH